MHDAGSMLELLDTLDSVTDVRPLAFLPRGALVGRYMIISVIGCGGLGTVYAAYDPELDRRVAIKVMRPDSADGGTQAARARMVREAKAMARVSHPNVVAIHDVGTHGHDVFIAMELVEGVTLRQWLDEDRRSWREILDVFGQAAMGLAAAHAVGLVHRDFKPENVLIGDDQRVRVLDFGLARASAATDAPRISSMLSGVAGTPAYMSPEQHLQLQVDARSDQFSFCVALHEALYGRRPFGGNTLAAIGYNATQGIVDDAPNQCAPLALRAIILRGLRPEPRDRWTSMLHLVQRLGSVRKNRRRLVIGATIAAAAFVVLAAFGYVVAKVAIADADPPPKKACLLVASLD